MTVRNFNGSTDRLNCGIGAASGMTFGTFAILMRRTETANVGILTGLHSSGGTIGGLILYDANSYGIAIDADEVRGAGSGAAHTNWQFVMIRKATGNAVARKSSYNYDTDTWSHQPASAALANWPSPGAGGVIRFDYQTSSFPIQGRVAVRALWANALPFSDDSSGDAALEAAGFEVSLANWVAANPTVLHAFNQAAVTDPVEDLSTAGTADEVSRTGTTVITGDDPPGFSFGADEVDADLDGDLPALAGSFTVQVGEEVTVDLDGALPPLAGAFDVDVDQSVDADLDGDLPALAGAFTIGARIVTDWSDPVQATTFAADEITTDLAGDLPALAGAFTVDAQVTADLDGDLPGLVGAFTIDSLVTVDLPGVLPALAGSFEVDAGVTADLDGNLPALGGALTIQVGDEITVTLTGVLPPLEGAYQIEYGPITADLDGDLPGLAGAYLVTVGDLVFVDLDGDLPELAGSFTIDAQVTADLDGDLPPLAGAFTVDVTETIVVTLSGDLPELAGSFTVEGGPTDVDLTGILPALVGSFTVRSGLVPDGRPLQPMAVARPTQQMAGLRPIQPDFITA